MPIISRMHSAVGKIFTLDSMFQGIEYSFRQLDPDIEKGNSAMSNIYRLYSIGGKAFKGTRTCQRKEFEKANESTVCYS